MESGLQKFIKAAERWTVIALLLMMVLVILLSTVELGVMLVKDLMGPPFPFFNIAELLELFGFFFMILIGLELIETIKMYLDESKIHVEVVFLVAMIAVARKVIILDAKTRRRGCGRPSGDRTSLRSVTEKRRGAGASPAGPEESIAQ